MCALKLSWLYCSHRHLSWTSTPANDYDTDGCRDDEDSDDDNDGVADIADNCPKGNGMPWTSTPGNDNDGDGCSNAEDDDDDSDGVIDVDDNCIFVANPDQLDYDNDSAILGIGFSGDACDDDDDNDGVLDTTDLCHFGNLGWTSTVYRYDADGVRIRVKILDDDKMEFAFEFDSAPMIWLDFFQSLE